MSIEHIVRIEMTPDTEAYENIDTQEKLQKFIEFCLKTWPVVNKDEFTVEVSKPMDPDKNYAMVLDDSETHTSLSGCSIHEFDENDEIDVGDGSESIFYFV